MTFQDLTKAGMRPAGSGAGNILEGILKGAEAFLPNYLNAKKQKQKSEKDKVDMYISLRKAGYSKEDAHNKTLKGLDVGEVSAEDQFDQEEEERELALKSKRLDIEKKEAEKKRDWVGKASFTERFNDDLGRALEGTLDWDELKKKYPTKIENIDTLEAQHTLVKKSPKFKEGKGWEAWKSPNVAKLTPKTKAVISQIKNQEDLDEFIERMDEAEKKGIDVKAILEYFGVE